MKTIYNPGYRRVIDRIKAQRLASRISQKEAGARVQKSRQWIAKIEMHELRLDILNFVQLCKAYKLKPSDLIKFLEEESSEDDFSLDIDRSRLAFRRMFCCFWPTCFAVSGHFLVAFSINKQYCPDGIQLGNVLS